MNFRGVQTKRGTFCGEGEGAYSYLHICVVFNFNYPLDLGAKVPRHRELHYQNTRYAYINLSGGHKIIRAFLLVDVKWAEEKRVSV